MSSTPKPYVPLRSPTPPLGSSSEDLNELSLDQELASLERPHFLDPVEIGIPYPVKEQPPPIPPRYPLTNSLPLVRRSSIPVKMIQSADNVPSLPQGNARPKHFLDENPVRPDYDYNNMPRSLDRQYEHHDSHAIKMPFDGRRPSGERKSRKIKEPSYTLSRFLENDDNLNQYNDNEVQLNDVNLCAKPTTYASSLNFGIDSVLSILSVIGYSNTVDISQKFLDLSKSPNTCATLRQSKCIPILVQMIHCETDETIRKQAREALRNVVNFHHDDKVGRREAKVLRYIELIMDYCDTLNKFKDNENNSNIKAMLNSENHPLQAMRSLMNISFDEEHRHSMCTLGALQTIANLVYYDHAVYGSSPNDTNCISLRRYAGMALTNLTFGDGNNKALLCSNLNFMKALVAQINNDADDLLHVTANVLRNLSWRADNNMKTILNEIGTVTALTQAAMKNENENTLRAILSALWNLSAHCSKNKAEFCMVDGALLFLVEMLTYESPSKTPYIIENAGGILRNVSSHIAVNENFRKILRQRNCLGILLQQLKSESLTIVSNACGTLWNLSARCPEDQKFLWDNGAVPMLRSLIHSKHKMISNGSKVALKNLVNFRPGEMNHSTLDPVARKMGLKELPTLSARKQRALEDELDENLSETCENIEATKSISPHIVQTAPKSFSVLERDQEYMERSFGHLSLQSNPRQSANTANKFWESKPFKANANADFNMNPAAPQHSTGAIPKRPLPVETTETNNTQAAANESDQPHKDEPHDADQITNFSLVDQEFEHKERTFSVAEDDTIKCYINEGDTPLLSTATSVSDLRPLPKHPAPPVMHRHSKSGRTTTENSGINTPEKPFSYCEEGTPAYFSRRDSFSSLHEEAEFIEDNIEMMHKPNQLNIIPAHSANGNANGVQTPNHPNAVDKSRQDNASASGTVPTTPGECASKSVTFNNFNLETPMMFSRHSSLGSLASNEPAMNDDIISVISETSRMPSGTISPSEIPDSPSQTMPQSPRRKHANMRDNSWNQQRLPVEDEVRTFGVENTPALISCATSLSNLSMDDEPKIANDLLIKEMRLMHHLSDEQDDEAFASTSANHAMDEQCDAGEALSDTDESINDDDSLLKNCISIGMNVKNIEPDNKSTPTLPKPDDIFPDDSSSDEADENPDELLQQCIRSGITKTAPPAPTHIPAIKKVPARLPLQQLLKENPIGMLRKGGNSFIETNYDEPNRFQIEDSPCNFSIASGLSDLTVGSHTAGLLKINKLNNQSNENDELGAHANQNPPLSPLLVDSQENHQHLDQARLSQKASNATSSQSSTAVTVQDVNEVNAENAQFDDVDSNSSISSIDSNDSNDSNVLLEQCIQFGMSKTTQAANPSKVVASNLSNKSQLPTLRASTSQLASNHRSRPTRREKDDKQLLMDCINAGMERNVRSRSTVIEESPPRSPLKRLELEQFHNMPSKNVQATSATVYHTVGATDVVTDQRKGTACAQDQHQTAAKPTQTSSKGAPAPGIHVSTTEITSVARIQTETGYNNAALSTSTLSTKSHNSFNMGNDTSLLERSNEYPAHLGQNESIYDSQHSSSIDMEVSNECLFENQSPCKMDKHKDPNLMLQSVERLTHELVSTAEYLRTANLLDDDVTITESKITLTTSNNTWNDDTNPNAALFPEMSQPAPVIANSNDDDVTISETDGSRFEMATSELAEQSKSRSNSTSGGGLRFEIGGKVNQINRTNSTTTTMTNSTIIAIEANKIRSQLMKDDKNDSTVSLDKIRPPSVMDKMNNSSYCDSWNGASSLNKSPARFLSQGFMARRALQNNASAVGSTDSINSSCNLDKVKPPSIMDDLLDSMISVDSIASEYVDNPLPQLNEDPSYYETAFSECDDMTITLKNCAELPYETDKTPCGSDFSSVESTPKKGRRSLTPRRKRQLTKERYQTYTISTNDGETYQTAANGDTPSVPPLFNGSDSDAISLVSSDGEMSSLRAFTKNLPYLNDLSKYNDTGKYDANINNNDIVNYNDVSINTNTFTKLRRGSKPKRPSVDGYESLPVDNNMSSNSSGTMGSPNRTINKSPRIVKPAAVEAGVEAEKAENQPDPEIKAVRGQKKPAYVSPYSMAKLSKSPVQPKVPSKTVSPKSESTKTSPKTVESKAKSFIQRSAESLKKMRPSFTSRLTKQSPTKKSSDTLSRQQSSESFKSSETLVRQGTFIKDEPSEGDIPVIASMPTSPKHKSLVSRIPFNRTTSLQTTRNVTKCKTNIEIPLQKAASSTFIRRTMKSASSASQLSSPSRGSFSQKHTPVESPSSSKSLFNRWTPPNKKVSPLPANATKVNVTKAPSRESIGAPKAAVGAKMITATPNRASKIATNRPITTNGRTTKV